jgi:DNA-binding SARP family transcriptional activator
MASNLNIRLFGRLTIERNGHSLPDIERKHQELFVYLLLDRRRIHSREVLAGQFWGEATTTQSKKNLRQALWQIHSLLAPNGGRDSVSQDPSETPLLQIDDAWVQVDQHAAVWIDTVELENANEQTQSTPGGQFAAPVFERLKNAVDQYRGDLFEGCYQDWCLFERERLQNLYLTCLGKLMDYCEIHHEYELGLDFCGRILRVDWCHEPTYRRMMRFYYFLGDRTAAIRQFQHCCAALKKELNIEPEARTLALFRFLQTGQAEPEMEPGTGITNNGKDDAPDANKTDQGEAGDVIVKLGVMRKSLANIQRQAQESIKQIDQMIKKIG